jgi:hypothetical protein
MVGSLSEWRESSRRSRTTIYRLERLLDDARAGSAADR